MMTQAVPSRQLSALQRAMPMTRLIDCGMDFNDAAALFARIGNGEAWDVAAEAIANDHVSRARDAEAEKRLITCAEELRRAVAALIFAQMAFNFDTPRKAELYHKLAAASRRLCAVHDIPSERIEVPFAGKHLVGWLVRPVGRSASGTVVLFGGQSGWGMAYLPAARALAKRGLATILAEGPGQGETRIGQRMFLDVDVPAAYQAFVDFIAADPSLGRPGIWGNSYGGLWAAKTAARDRRLAACCVNGSFARPKILPFRTALEQSAAMLGTEDEGAIERNFARMAFDPAVDRIDCPLLVLHGGADPLVELADQEPFLAAATGEKTLRVWPDGEHTIYNHGFERTSLVADWFAMHLR